MAAFAVVTFGCTAPNVTAPIEGIPVCPDFEIGAARTKMKGGLRMPVVVAVLEDADDDEPASDRTVLGRRTEDSPVPKVVVQDKNETYFITFSQCPNARAPRPVETDVRKRAEVAGYACGEAKEYHRVELKVIKGDTASRVIEFAPPPDTSCWSSAVPEAAQAKSAQPAASASTADASAEPAPGDGDAEASTDGGSDAAATPTAAASTAATSASTAAPDKGEAKTKP